MDKQFSREFTSQMQNISQLCERFKDSHTTQNEKIACSDSIVLTISSALGRLLVEDVPFDIREMYEHQLKAELQNIVEAKEKICDRLRMLESLPSSNGENYE